MFSSCYCIHPTLNSEGQCTKHICPCGKPKEYGGYCNQCYLQTRSTRRGKYNLCTITGCKAPKIKDKTVCKNHQ